MHLSEKCVYQKVVLIRNTEWQRDRNRNGASKRDRESFHLLLHLANALSTQVGFRKTLEGRDSLRSAL